MEATALSRLDWQLQQWVSAQGWHALRPLQHRAVHAILDSHADVLLLASTASGKTEAAILPLLSMMAQQVNLGQAPLCLYVCPLKALINDLTPRLESLAGAVNLPVFPWHGETGQSVRRRFRRNPQGILVTTPESLEAILIRDGPQIPTLFNGLGTVILDEWHAFLSNERGRQVRCQLARIEARLKRCIRRIGLSATIGLPQLAAKALRGADSDDTIVLEEDSVAARPRPLLDIDSVCAGPEQSHGSAAEWIVRRLRHGRHIVFTNSRRDVEALSVELHGLSATRTSSMRFVPHHSSLSRSQRLEGERSLKEGGGHTTVLATSTLELGIDIGELDSICQFGAPRSVSSLKQRLGRCGRRHKAAQLGILLLRAPEGFAKGASAADRLWLELIESIAAVELLLAGWTEPAKSAGHDWSTLVQQILSCLAECHDISALTLYERLCRCGPFGLVTPQQFSALLNHLGRSGYIRQDAEGTLGLDTAGEALVHHHDFLAAFPAQQTVEVRYTDDVIGELPIQGTIPVGSTFVLAGRTWYVTACLGRSLFVIPATNGSVPLFLGGTPDLSSQVSQATLQVLLSTDYPSYLSESAMQGLGEARATFARLRLAHERWTDDHTGSYCWTWLGTATNRTLAASLNLAGVKATYSDHYVFCADRTAAECRPLLHSHWTDHVSLAARLAAHVDPPAGKFGHMVPEDLRRLDALATGYDMVAARGFVLVHSKSGVSVAAETPGA